MGAKENARVLVRTVDTINIFISQVLNPSFRIVIHADQWNNCNCNRNCNRFLFPTSYICDPMRPLLRKNYLFFSYCSFSVQVQARELSSSPHRWRCPEEEEEESRNVKVSVWWDFENCQVPAGIDLWKVAPAITEAVRTNGIKGPLSINAFGDVQLFSKAYQEALAYTGIHFTHIPGGKNSADRFLLLDLMCWVSQNPPPAHLFLISGDGDFAGILHRLRMNNYNILLASSGMAPDVLCSAATIMWQWSSLVKGEDLSGKHFNRPPDGSFCSWYGNNKVTLQTSCSSVEHSTSVRNLEVYKPSLDSKLGPVPVPKSVVKQVRHLLRSHPKGISITDLRAELIKCNVRLDKNFYGYRNFSGFLSSIPHVQLQPLGDGKFCVRFVPSESPKPVESNDVQSVTSVAKIYERRNAETLAVNDEDKNKVREANEMHSTASINERSVDDDSKSFQPAPPPGNTIGEYMDGNSSFSSLGERYVSQPPNELQKSSVCSEKVGDVATSQLSKIQQSLKDDKVSKTETGSLKMSYKKLPDNDIVRPEDACDKIQEKCTTSSNHSAGKDQTMVENIGIANYGAGTSRAMNKYENPTRKEVNEVCHGPSVDKRPVRSGETYRKGPTLLGWIRSWWPFSKSNTKSGDSTHQNMMVSDFEDSNLSVLDRTVQTVSHLKEPKLSEMDQNVNHFEMPELFSSGSFWNDIESYVFTPEGSRLVSQSRSREDMAHKLQKDGPLVLRSLTEKDILQLAELLIAEKKWLQESPSQAFPFRLTQSAQRNSLVGQSHAANGLRSLFLSRTSQSNLQKSVEHDVEKHNQSIAPNRTSQSNLQKSVEHDMEEPNQSIPCTRVSTTSTEMKYTERSRNDILEDCQKLVSEILREHPEGYNISTFRTLFVDRYSYHLDVQKLGYQKLTALLQIIPGVKVESAYIFPSIPSVSASDGETSVLRTIVTNENHAHAVPNSDSGSDSAPKDDNMESPWEELGPISINNSNQSGLEPKLSQKAIELDASKHPDCKSIVSDFSSSESEGDCCCITQTEPEKAKYNEQNSSLLQVLDLLHSYKEGENSVKKSDNVDVLGISVADILNSSTESTRDTPPKSPSGNYIEKQRSQILNKKYSFVADPVLSNNKDKLMVGGLLDDSTKAGETRMQP